MPQTVFTRRERHCTEDDINNLELTFRDIFVEINKQINSRKTLSDIITGDKVLSSEDLAFRQKPEPFTRKHVINPILKCLGYTGSAIADESGQDVESTTQWADYTLDVENNQILVEAEPLGKNLWVPNSGANQVKTWISSKGVTTDYGMATNGMMWILLKYNRATHKIEDLTEADLRPFFVGMLGQENIRQHGSLKEFYKSFSKANILATLNENLLDLEKQKEEISKKFYSQYLELVFGKLGKTAKAPYSLMTAIKAPSEATRAEVALFAIRLMNRLFFMKFLEDKGLVNPNFLSILWEDYKSKAIPVSYYRSYLDPLFFSVLNTPPEQRSADINRTTFFKDIPYLNGGLFRAGRAEREYDVEDDILERIIKDLLGKYTFSISGRSGKLDPVILGNVFEKTVNYIASPGTDAQKMKGAYYTPDDVTAYITKNTLHPFLLGEIITKLEALGWKEAELRHYDTLESFLDDLPRNTNDIVAVLEIVDKVSILDPACGSGHFLTVALNELVYIKERLLKAINRPYQVYEVKRQVVSYNLYGVDIEEEAVEIAKLRLWLGLIEDLLVSDTRHMETLPNIEFNVITGDSLNGWLNEQIPQRSLKPIEMDIEPSLERLEQTYSGDGEKLTVVRDVKRAIHTYDMNQILAAYSGLRRMYPFESLKASSISNTLNQIRYKINELVVDSLITSSIKQEGTIKAKSNKRDELEESLKKAFNWRVEFYDILQRGGFDVVIGNPPYVESVDIGLKLYGKYNTAGCGNTYAHFLERAMNLTRRGGRIGFIASMSAFCTQRMQDLIILLENGCSEIKLSHFGWRPSKLFKGVNRALSIMLARKKMTGERCLIYTTTYMKWYSNERPALFQKIHYHKLTKRYEPFIIAKIGTELEDHLLEKIYRKREKRIGAFMISKKTEHVIYYRTTGGLYWKIITDFQPEFYRNGVRDESSREKHLYFPNNEYKEIALALYNSNLFWWLYTINSNGRDLNPFDLTSIPIDLDNIPANIKDDIRRVSGELMKELRKNSEFATRSHEKKEPVLFQKISPRKSKPLIDEIDRLLAQIYGFTDEEVNFLTKYDERFRMGAEDEEEFEDVTNLAK